MSPVVIPPGYTRDYLDGKITLKSQLHRIRQSFDRITSANDVRHNLFFMRHDDLMVVDVSTRLWRGLGILVWDPS